MPKFAAFLRGINVGGHRVTKGELIGVFELVGMRDVVTWRASGNVVFEAPSADEPSVEADLEEALQRALGYAVPVLVRSASDVRRIAETPVPGGEGRGKPQVILLRRPPSPSEATRLPDLAGDDEQLTVDGREIFWSPSRGVADSELDLIALEKLLSPTTMRTQNTIREIGGRWFPGG